jgi:hypothetical protein
MAGEIVWPEPIVPAVEGKAAGYLAVAAVDLRDGLDRVPNVPASGRKQMINADRVTIYDWQELERRVPAAFSELSVESGRTLADQLERLHFAMPYSEAERRWFRIAYGDPEIGWNDMRQAEVEVVSGGLRHVVYGRELFRKWWAWRRDTDEFEGQGGRAEACQVLDVLADRFTIDAVSDEA